ncbi:MAG TPA: hypothetical protein VGA29_02550, partial [Ignavibacteriaceae bacterium]
MVDINEIETQEQELARHKDILASQKQNLILQSTRYSQAFRQPYTERIGLLQSNIKSVGRQQQELSEFKVKFQEQQSFFAQQQKYISDYNLARKYYARGKFPFGEEKSVLNILREFRSGRKAQIGANVSKAISLVEEQNQMTLGPEARENIRIQV